MRQCGVPGVARAHRHRAVGAGLAPAAAATAAPGGLQPPQRPRRRCPAAGRLPGRRTQQQQAPLCRAAGRAAAAAGVSTAAEPPPAGDLAPPPRDGTDEDGALGAGPAAPTGGAQPPLPAKALLQGVTHSATRVLPPQPSWAAAVAALRAAVAETATELAGASGGGTSSGALRWEAPLPRGGPAAAGGSFTALQWLQGQHASRASLHQAYFSTRRSTAPDTPGTAAAEGAAQGWASVAGLGAAWLWQGPPGRAFDGAVMSGLQRFLSEAQPRLRVLGGTRFNCAQAPAPEWAAFGSYLFLLPQLEVAEVDGSLLLAVNAAWDSRLPEQLEASEEAAGRGPASLAQAAQQALDALAVARPPAPSSFPSLAPATGPAEHTPDEAGWERLLADAVRALRGGPGSGAARGGVGVDTELARQEFIEGGQQGLDELLSALLGDPDPAPVATTSEEELEEDEGGRGGGAAAAVGCAASATSSSPDGSSGDASGGLLQEAQVESHAAAAGRQALLPPGQQWLQDDPQQQQQQQQQQLVKLVLARRTALPWGGGGGGGDGDGADEGGDGPCRGWQRVSGPVLLQALQERDPRAYQLYLSTPPGAAFVACTPERLYVRSGRRVASEAVAGTRPRGPPGDLEADFYQGLDLLQSPKDHEEFSVVREWIKQQMAPLCVSLRTEVQKSVLKQAAVQHLYGRLAGTLRRGVGDAALLAALHPTPAVCGRPREAALRHLGQAEPFDRGFYAGPCGWVSGQGAEFVVAIRSALLPVQPPAQPGGGSAAAGAAAAEAGGAEQAQRLLAYAGVGVVRGSQVAAEWQELCLKVRQFEGLLSPLLAPRLAALPNVQLAWATLVVEELTRLGVSTFAVAPGSRSSPLALAAASHPRSQLTIAVDERTLGFWALGFGRANPSGLPAAVICSSGTAVANLLPAVVEASQSNVPLLLLTADRPYELRDTGANQTIDQVKIFGGYTRWASDVAAPVAAADAGGQQQQQQPLPGRVAVGAVDAAVRHATAAPRPGPVHLNFQFREPLAPSAAPWSPAAFLRGLEAWQGSAEPFTAAVSMPAGAATAPAVPPPELGRVLRLLRGARRGLVVVGEQPDPGAAAAGLQLAALLGWPAAADVLSGLRVGSSGGAPGAAPAAPLHHVDLLLLGDQGSWWPELQPDVVLQLGPRVTSKRLNQLMEWSALGGGDGGRPATPWLFVGAGPDRHDAAHLLSAHLSMTPQQLLGAVAEHWRAADAAADSGERLPGTTIFPETSGSGRAAGGAGGRARSSRHAPQPPPHQQQQQQQQQQQEKERPSAPYAELLSRLDEAAGAAIDAALADMPELSEMAVARVLSEQLPAGAGLFLGNSMPIRDMDMCAGPRRRRAPLAAPHVAAAAIAAGSAGSPTSFGPSGGAAGAAADAPGADECGDEDEDGAGGSGSGSGGLGLSIGSLPPGGLLGAFRAGAPQRPGAAGAEGRAAASDWGGALPEALVGAPVAANRGASGIDGVVSTAAGFAAGLRRPVTLVVGDLSFLHDANGLSLLRGGEMAPPLTIVLVNNRGGGIFSFLPVAGAVGREAFERLWGTPQNVDLEGICRAHGIPHQRVTTPEELPAALATAWGIGRHSVVEVQTDRQANVRLHRQMQAAVEAAVHKAHALLRAPAAGGGLQGQQRQPAQPARRALPALPPVLLRPQLAVADAAVSSYSLPLARPLTSQDAAAARKDAAAAQVRRGLLLTVTLAEQAAPPPGAAAAAAAAGFSGVGEAAPLPGLHAESHEAAEGQLQMLAELLRGLPVPRTLALLDGGALTRWVRGELGVDPAALAPSVRAALESALLQALAAAHGCSLAELLLPAPARGGGDVAPGAGPAGAAAVVPVNGLLPGGGSAAEAVAAAQRMADLGFRAVKVKVGRRDDPEEDAAVVLALHSALAPRGVALTADANRAWTLDQALAFGRALRRAGPGGAAGSGASGGPQEGGGCVLEYIEEPTRDPSDMAAFHAETGIPVAADESLDQGLLGPAQHTAAAAGRRRALEAAAGGGGGGGASEPPERLDLGLQGGLAAVVIKPSVVGGFEAAWALARWAQRRGLRAVVSSSFESGVGLAALSQLAAAVDGAADAPAAKAPAGGAGQALANGLWSGLGGAGLPTSSRAAWRSTPTAAEAVEEPAGERRPDRQAQQQRWHGLGTLAWFAGDVLAPATGQQQQQQQQQQQDTPGCCGGAAVDAGAAWALLQDAAAQGRRRAQAATGAGAPAALLLRAEPQRAALQRVEYGCRSPSGAEMRVTGLLARPPAQRVQRLPVVLLHGFLGGAADWRPLVAALAAAGHPCLAVDLPGHGGTGPAGGGAGAPGGGASCYTVAAAAAAAQAAAAAAFGAGAPCLLLGYSMGARVALQLCLSPPPAEDQGQQQQQQQQQQHGRATWAGAVLVSGTPGIPDPDLRAGRVVRDAELASLLERLGAARFLRWWYRQPLWRSLRRHPSFGRLVDKRAAEQRGREAQLAAALRNGSTGGMEPLWSELRTCRLPLLLVAGELDPKFSGIKRRMAARLRQGAGSSAAAAAAAAPAHRWAEVPGAGHAVHVEAPLQLLALVRDFAESVQQQQQQQQQQGGAGAALDSR